MSNSFRLPVGFVSARNRPASFETRRTQHRSQESADRLTQRDGGDAGRNARTNVEGREAPVADPRELVRLRSEGREGRVRAEEADDEAAADPGGRAQGVDDEGNE